MAYQGGVDGDQASVGKTAARSAVPRECACVSPCAISKENDYELRDEGWRIWSHVGRSDIAWRYALPCRRTDKVMLCGIQPHTGKT